MGSLDRVTSTRMLETVHNPRKRRLSELAPEGR
jgi:hypothetical protein